MLNNVSLLKLENGDKRMCIITESDSVKVSIGGNDYCLYYVYDTDNNIRVIKEDKEKNIMDKIVKLDDCYFHCCNHSYYDENDRYQREFAFFVDVIGD